MAGEKTESEEEQLVPVGPGSDDLNDEETGTVQADARVGHSEEDDEDDESSEELSAPGRKPFHEMSAQEKRDWRASKKDRQKRAKERDRTELNFLRSRNEDLERRFTQLETRTSQHETVTVDQRIGQMRAQVQVADQIIAKAVENGDGESLVEAQKVRDNLNRDIQKLESVKTNISTSRQAPQQQPPRPDPEVARRATQFMQKHSWYNPRQPDDDSDLVTTLDRRVKADGFDPSTPEYWEELEDRLQRYLPHRFQNGKGNEEEAPKAKVRKGPSFSTAGREHRPLKKGEVYVSQERKEAMVEAGVWDDPVLRSRYLKAYSRYDKENGRTPA